MKFHIKKYVIVTSILLSVLLLFKRQFLPFQSNPKPIDNNNVPISFDLIKQRNKFENPIYTKWKSSTNSLSLDPDLTIRCNDYFQQLNKENFQIDYNNNNDNNDNNTSSSLSLSNG